MLRKKFGKKPKIKPSLKSASNLQNSEVGEENNNSNIPITESNDLKEIPNNDSTSTSNNSPEKLKKLPDTTFAVPISPPRHHRIVLSSSSSPQQVISPPSKILHSTNEILANDHNVPIPSRELQADQSYLQAYNCRPPKTIIGGQKITPEHLEKIKNGNSVLKLKDRKRKIDDVIDLDQKSFVAESIRSTATSTTSRASKHRMRSAEVKDKMSSMEKDSEGNVIIDKEKFQLADLIYINRHYGKRKTGLQERRERKEKQEKELKLAVELKAKEEEQAEQEKNEDSNDKKEDSDLKITKTETGTDGTVIKGENLEQMITRSRTNSETSSVHSKKVSSQELIGDTTTNDQPAILIEARVLTKEELTRKNQDALSHLNIRQGEDGEMIVDINNQVIQERSKLEPTYSADVTTIQNHNSQESDLSDTYRRCFVKKKPSTSAPPTKSRRWSNKENELFWDALSIVGQDFSMMEYWFKQKKVKRNKSELKSKFQREDKIFSERINLCLRTAAKRSLKESDFDDDATQGMQDIGNNSQTVMAT